MISYLSWMLCKKSCFENLELLSFSLVFFDEVLVLTDFVMNKKIFLDLAAIVDNFSNGFIEMLIDIFLSFDDFEEGVKISRDHCLTVTAVIIDHFRL